MDSAEIKKTYSMLDVIARYGIKADGRMFANCPFHKEKSNSMKIYEDSYHCFGCGESGDIFTFVQKMENISFKDAFLSLGGMYEKPSFESKMALYHSRKRREMLAKERLQLLGIRQKNNSLITIYRKWCGRSEPFSDAWTDCYNKLQYQLYLHEILNRKEVGSCGH